MSDTYFSRIILWLGFVGICLAFIHNVFSEIPFPFVQIDEHAHYSYNLYVLHGPLWPDFMHFPLYDTITEQPFSGSMNYLNHPPIFYIVTLPIQALLTDLDPIYARIFPTLVSVIAVLIFTWFGLKLYMPPLQATCYMAFPFLLHTQSVFGFYSNDCLAFLGGFITCAASYYVLRNSRRAVMFMLLGVLLSSVKLTSLLLVGIYAAYIAWHARHFLFSFPHIYRVLSFALLVLAVAPYIYMWLNAGSPAPTTPGQLAHISGTQSSFNDMYSGFSDWLLHSLAQFADQFAGPEYTLIPLSSLIASWVIIICQSAKRNPLNRMAQAALIATATTLSCHLLFSWSRYAQWGWTQDMILRYYFPLIPAYAITIRIALITRKDHHD